MKNVLCLLAFLVFACQPERNVSQTSSNKMPLQKRSVKYLALGDSYTIGTDIGVRNSYPTILGNRLENQAGYKDADIKIIAKNGWTTDNLLQGIAAENLSQDWDLVTLLIGVNNQYQHQSKIQYRHQFRQLLERSIQFAGSDTSRVFVLSIPDYGVTPNFGAGNQAIAGDIDQFNTINKEISDSLNVTWFNITKVSRTALNHSDLAASGGPHFSPKMQQMWVDVIYPTIKDRLDK